MSLAASKAEAAIEARFPGTRFGRYNRRPISGTTTWSQHSWDNGRDVYPPLAYGSRTANDRTPGPYLDYLDEVNRWLSTQPILKVRTRLFRVENHWNHIHVDFWPKGVGTPPVTIQESAAFQQSGGLPVLVSGWYTASADAANHPAADGGGVEDVETIKAIQSALNAGGWKGADGKPLTVDGVWGPNTQFALNAALTPNAQVAAQVKSLASQIAAMKAGLKTASV